MASHESVTDKVFGHFFKKVSKEKESISMTKMDVFQKVSEKERSFYSQLIAPTQLHCVTLGWIAT